MGQTGMGVTLALYIVIWQVLSFPGFKGSITVKGYSHFIHITDDYLSKILLCLYFVKVLVASYFLLFLFFVHN